MPPLGLGVVAGCEPGLVIRRSSPGLSEQFIAIHHRNFATITNADWSFNELEPGVGGVYVHPDWLYPKTGIKLPVALVGTRDTPAAYGDLYIYRFGPPTSFAFTPAKESVRLSWVLPAAESGLALADCISCYRLFGRTATNAPPVPLAVDGGKLAVAPDQTSVLVPQSVLSKAGFTWLGIACEEKMLKDHDEPLISPIAWIGQDVCVFPTGADMTFGDELQLRVFAGFMGENPPTKWRVAGGEITPANVFKAGTTEGTFELIPEIGQQALPAHVRVLVRIFRPVPDAELIAEAQAFVTGPLAPAPPPGVRISEVRNIRVDRMVRDSSKSGSAERTLDDAATGITISTKYCAWLGSVTFERNGTRTETQADGSTSTEPWADTVNAWGGLKAPAGQVEVSLLQSASSLDSAF